MQTNLHLFRAIFYATSSFIGKALFVLLFFTPLSAQGQNPTTLAEEEENIRLTDGIFREYRLALLFSKDDFESEKFNRDKNKIESFLTEIETYLNDMYVRDAGIRFTMVHDDRLIDETLNAKNVTVDNATQLINDRIGSNNYDVGIAMAYDRNNGQLNGLSYIAGIKYDYMKGGTTVMNQDSATIGHELAHHFGSSHTFDVGSEPKPGQSICGYGFSSVIDYLSLYSLNAMLPHTQAGDILMPESQRHTFSDNTPPHIDREKMQREYIVPRNTFFSIPVYASDEEQQTLYYAYNQWGFSTDNKAHFPTFPPSHDNIINIGRRYNIGNCSLVPNSDKVPVGEYKMLISVSDALPTDEAISKKQAPLYDCYLTQIKVVDVDKPFKITSAVGTQPNPAIPMREAKAGQRITLTWDVDDNFFDKNSRVRISLSDDGGETFPYTLVPSAPNNGSCEVVMPQAVIGKKETYESIFFLGQAVLRLEVIDKGYYDITNNSPINGGMMLNANPIEMHNLPTSNFIQLKPGEPMPDAPLVTASKKGTMVNVTYSETTDNEFTRRYWVASDGIDENCYVQYIERLPNTPINIKFSNTKGSIEEIDWITTFSAPYNTQLAEGVKAYYITRVDETTGKAILREWHATTIPANEGMLLTSATGDDAVMLPANDQTAKLENEVNLLGHTANGAKTITTDDCVYLLTEDADEVIFHHAEPGNILPANKAYLMWNGKLSTIWLVTEITSTAIKASENATETEIQVPLYDLSGRCVKQFIKGGVYIRKGKKIVYDGN